ncbi:hypothetical protein PHISCL_10944 [Aspergillus sclerotialis]|uniref:Uncharacterized protein n=1 Tax=Aspergillus sclerotialis TaxID=2070753 RepID=A0A3A2Z0T7_9EURO|nr:hypothetical protein PHISCL_10944 [Aspergillus sclerotialis]
MMRMQYLRGLNLPRVFLGDMALRFARDLIELGVEVHLAHRQALRHCYQTSYIYMYRKTL